MDEHGFLWRADLPGLKHHIAQLIDQIRGEVVDDNQQQQQKRDNPGLLQRLQTRGPGLARNGQVTELFDPGTNSLVHNEPERMNLLKTSWQQWWHHPPGAPHATPPPHCTSRCW